MTAAAANRVAWFSLSWTSRWLPDARAAAKVFLGVHGVQGEQALGQAKGCDHLLGGRDFIAFLVGRQMAEDDLPVAGEGARQMRRLAVVERVEAAAQRFAIDGHTNRSVHVCSHGRGEFGGMLAEHPL